MRINMDFNSSHFRCQREEMPPLLLRGWNLLCSAKNQEIIRIQENGVLWSKECVRARVHRSVFVLYTQSISPRASVIRHCVRPLTKQRHHSGRDLGSCPSPSKSLPKCITRWKPRNSKTLVVKLLGNVKKINK